ncbi:MAG: putative rane protein [Vampirovibrio sp.]|jgi:uncharacterized membrane protein YcaP (DUF421 family)|nr:putative rane protein [Vampirovibrio sp.]
MQELIGFHNSLLGIDQDPLSLWQMGIRAVIVYIVGLVLVRFGNKRFQGRFTVFDFILSIILGSVISRAITGNPFYPTLFAAFVLVVVHGVFSNIAFFSSRFGELIKGTHRLLIDDGKIQWREMRQAGISQRDLEQALRTQMHTTSLEGIKEARLERNGRISFIPKDQETAL